MTNSTHRTSNQTNALDEVTSPASRADNLLALTDDNLAVSVFDDDVRLP